MWNHSYTMEYVIEVTKNCVEVNSTCSVLVLLCSYFDPAVQLSWHLHIAAQKPTKCTHKTQTNMFNVIWQLTMAADILPSFNMWYLTKVSFTKSKKKTPKPTQSFSDYTLPHICAIQYYTIGLPTLQVKFVRSFMRSNARRTWIIFRLNWVRLVCISSTRQCTMYHRNKSCN